MKVAILGAGLAGMACAYELKKRGHDAVLLEPRARSGGRCFSVRNGTQIVEDDGSTQICFFRSGLYFNPGPARIPQHHVTVDYCRALGVELEPFLNRNFGAYLHTDQGSFCGQRVPIRDIEFDLRGRAFEILGRGIVDRVVGEELSGAARSELLKYLESYGRVFRDDAGVPAYSGSDRRTPGQDPYSAEELLLSGFAWKMGFFEELDLQPTMLQPVGGMDRVAAAFRREVQKMIRLEREVTRIEANEESVRVHVAGPDCRVEEMVVDRVVCTIPLPVLADVEHNLGDAFRQATRAAKYETAVKVGLESTRRFWEDEGLYGGMTFTDLPITQIWYPSMGFGGNSGVLLGAYNFGQAGDEMSKLTPAQRSEQTRREVAAIHPESLGYLRTGVSVAWSRDPHARGAFALKDYSKNEVLAAPHPRLRLAGEHMSPHHGWMAGALESGAAAAEWVQRG